MDKSETSVRKVNMKNESVVKNIRVGFTAKRDPVFCSPVEAARTPRPAGHVARAREDTAALDGESVVRTCWNVHEAAFQLSSGRWLVIYEDDQIANWRISQESPMLSIVENADTFNLRYPNEQEELWLPGKVLRERMGKAFYLIYPTETEVAVYFRGMLRIDFVVRLNIDEQTPFLFWYDTE